MRRECRERFPPPPISKENVTWRACRDACRDRLPAVTGKTFPAFPAHAHPQFCVSGKRPIVTFNQFQHIQGFMQTYIDWRLITYEVVHLTEIDSVASLRTGAETYAANDHRLCQSVSGLKQYPQIDPVYCFNSCRNHKRTYTQKCEYSTQP